MATATLPITIPAGAALSAPFEIPPNLKLVRIGMPPAWDAAPLTFLISLDGANYLDLHHAAETPDGMWSSYPTGILSVAPNSIVLLPPDTGTNLGWLQLRSGLRSKPVNQQANRTFALVFG